MKPAVQIVNGLKNAVIAFALKIEESFASVVIILYKKTKYEIFIRLFSASGEFSNFIKALKLFEFSSQLKSTQLQADLSSFSTSCLNLSSNRYA